MPTPHAVDDTMHLIAAYVRNVALGRAMFNSGVYPHLNFWRVLQGNCMDMAAIEWCKLFGNDDKNNQPSHWKNVVPAVEHDAFRSGLYAVTGLMEQQWRAYRDTILEYRNRMAAHLDEPSKRPPNFPTYDKALLAASYYYDHIMSDARVRAANPDYPDDLMQYEDDFEVQALEIAKIALAATDHFEETVR